MHRDSRDPPVILVLDTSTAVAAVAVARGAEVSARIHARTPRAYDEGVVPAIREVLAAAGLSLADVDVVACGRGPGSFTGLRIGMATAKGYAFALDRPLVAVSSTAATALGAGNVRSAVVSIDAKREQLYLEAFTLGDDEAADSRVRAVRSVAGATIDAKAAGAWIAALRLPGPTALVGEAAGIAADVGRPDSAVIIDRSVASPRGSHLAALAARAAAKGEFSEPDSLEPTYLRPPPISRPRIAGR